MRLHARAHRQARKITQTLTCTCVRPPARASARAPARPRIRPRARAPLRRPPAHIAGLSPAPCGRPPAPRPHAMCTVRRDKRHQIPGRFRPCLTQTGPKPTRNLDKRVVAVLPPPTRPPNWQRSKSTDKRPTETHDCTSWCGHVFRRGCHRQATGTTPPPRAKKRAPGLAPAAHPPPIYAMLLRGHACQWTGSGKRKHGHFPFPAAAHALANIAWGGHADA